MYVKYRKEFVSDNTSNARHQFFFFQYRTVNYFSSKIFVTIWTKSFSFLEDNIEEHQFFYLLCRLLFFMASALLYEQSCISQKRICSISHNFIFSPYAVSKPHVFLQSYGIIQDIEILKCSYRCNCC